MARPKPGDVVIMDFPGATGTKRRPAVVLSSDLYHAQRPDAIVGLITSNLAAATSATDYLLLDWSVAGLHSPSAFRAYLVTPLQTRIRVVGHVSDRDWNAIRDCVHRAFA